MQILIILLTIQCLGCNNNNNESIILKDGPQKKLVEATLERTKHNITYNGSYFNINYPNGDIPKKFGVYSYQKILQFYPQWTDNNVGLHL